MVGDKYGKLTIIKQLKSNSKNRSIVFECKCDCGNIKKIRKDYLSINSSCGCDIKILPKLYIGFKVNKLTLISYTGKNKWLCKCECGEFKNIAASSIKSSATKSCGCIKSKNSVNIEAKKIWRNYTCRYGDDPKDLPFEDFYRLSQMPCYYCGIEPSRRKGNFIYNGLDRIDSFKKHTIENCVPCCKICNGAKSNRSVNEFKEYIKYLKIYNFTLKDLNWDNEIYSLISIAYKFYKKMSVDIKTFYSFSQLPCYYCGVEKLNHLKKSTYYIKSLDKNKNDFKYNGIDRIDSSKDHSLDNIVPCCKYCNFGKLDNSLEVFCDWMIRIKEFQKKKAQSED